MYIHSDIFAVQTPKKPGHPCGDAYGVFRDESATTLILADGLGSGIKAHIAANMCVSRLGELIRKGIPVRQAFGMVSATMDNAWGTGDPFSVFTIARILNNGQTTLLGYEMPPPILFSRASSQILRDRSYTRGKAVIHEASCVIDRAEGLMMFSDGITQAGIGKRFVNGWEAEGVVRYLRSLSIPYPPDGQAVAEAVHNQARSYWPAGSGDDCSVVLALNRKGVVVNLMSGPPVNRSMDEEWIKEFMKEEGIRILSGGSTAQIAARVLGKKLQVKDGGSYISPPSYSLEGFNLVSEGMVTLNQVYNLLDEDPEQYPSGSPASELAGFLKIADRVNIWLGQSKNLNEGNIEFKQQGLQKRVRIMQRISEKLTAMDKLVVIREA